MTITLKPDPRPALDRLGFRDTWRALDLLAEPHRDALLKVEQAQGAFLEMATGGDEPAAWCESCGVPFFEDDDYVQDGDGIATCRYDADGNRAGRCFRKLMEA